MLAKAKMKMVKKKGPKYWRGLNRPMTHVIQFYGMIGNVFMERTINMVPGSNLYLLHIACMEGKCINGGFDLTAKVEELVRNNRKSGKGKMLCGEEDASAASHACISYDISIKYS